MMNKKGVKSCLGWEGINNRILIDHFMTKRLGVSVILVYGPVGPIAEMLVTQINFTYSQRSK